MTVDLEAFDAVRLAWERVLAAPAPSPAVERPAGIPQVWPEAMAAMRGMQQVISREGRWTSGPSSLMEVLRLERREVANCRVVRWLLDPLASHGIGSLMLADLARRLGLDADNTSRCSVLAEVTRAETRADIVIHGLGDRTVVIEAKIDATESHRQASKLEAVWNEGEQLVFLTVRGTRQPTTQSDPGRWKPLEWQWLASRALELLDSSQVSGQHALTAQTSLRLWADSVRRNLR